MAKIKELWLARDNENRLYLYFDRPYSENAIILDPSTFRDITIKNSPKKVKII